MAYIYFTSDLHFDHINILNFCNRPYKSIEHMNIQLINNINNRVKPEDTLIHLGDLFFKIPGKKTNEYYWEKQINCKFINILGNHDINNSSKSIILNSIIKLGTKIVLVQHIPPTKDEHIPNGCDFVICGHVHNAWKVQLNKINNLNHNLGKVFINQESDINIPIINIGCDVWNYKPIRKDELLGYYNKIIKFIK